MHRSGTFYYFTIYQLNRGHRGRDRMVVGKKGRQTVVDKTQKTKD
jgi:hypothetical protein